MTKTLMVRGVALGTGIPRIAAPIVGGSAEEILAQAKDILSSPVDLIEWRADCFALVSDADAVLRTLARLREAIGGMPLIFTLRTAQEGGGFSLGTDAYVSLNKAAAASGLADLIDVELFLDGPVKELIAEIHRANVKVIGSSHDSRGTPGFGEIVERLREMQTTDADILKLALMANDKRDAAALLMATAEMSERYADRPLIAVSMGREGVVSRVAGEAFGSCLTFASVGKASAPGQLPAGKMADVLAKLHEAIV